MVHRISKSVFALSAAVLLCLTACQEKETDFLEPQEMSEENDALKSAAYKDFRIKMELSDRYAGGYGGPEVLTQWANSSSEVWSDWCQDANAYDPDYVRIGLDLDSDGYSGKDFRICIQLCDDGGNSTPGEEKKTNWASQGGGWSGWAGDKNNYNPDVFRMKIETRDGYDVEIEKFRLGIKCAELKSKSTPYQLGLPAYTPWNINNGGWSEWVSDESNKDPDVFNVCLDVVLVN